MKRYIVPLLTAILLLPITLQAQCDAPAWIMTDNIGPNYAHLIWDGDSTTNYRISYLQIGALNATIVTTTGNSIMLTGLDSLKEYRVQVQKVCSPNQYSLACAYYFVTTIVPNSRMALNYNVESTVPIIDYLGNLLYGVYHYAPYGIYHQPNAVIQYIVDSAYLSTLGTGPTEIEYFGFNKYHMTYYVGSIGYDDTIYQNDTMGNGIVNATIYMANVSEDELTKGFISDNATHIFHKVFDSTDFVTDSSGWKVYQMDSSFTWDGHSNILVTAYSHAVTALDDPAFQPFYSAHSVQGEKMVIWYTSIPIVAPTNLSSYTTYEECNSPGDLLLLTGDLSCIISEVSITDITYESATLNWNGSAQSCEFQYKAATDSAWGTSIILNNYSYQFYGLFDTTAYLYRVRSFCIDDNGDTILGKWIEKTFTTPFLHCNAPTSLEVLSKSFNSMTLNWYTDYYATGWDVHVWNNDFDYSYTTYSHPFAVTGLEQGTWYYVAVRSDCNALKKSGYSNTIIVTTPQCAEISGLKVTNITANTAELKWGGDGIEYDIEYGELHFTEGISTTIEHCTSKSHTITGLQPEHDYSVRVRQKCAEGVYSDYSSQLDFTTLAAPNDPPIEGIETTSTPYIAIFPNPTSDAATISISGVTGTVEVSLVDLNGHVVLAEHLECAGDCAKQLQVNGLSQGAYLVLLKGKGVNLVRKLIVE